MMKHASIWLLGVLLGFAAACPLDDELEDAVCESNADCWTNQTCVRTPLQEDSMVPLGLCRTDGKCAAGEQLGCACDVDGVGNRTCSGADLMADSEDASCMCVEASTT
ncbi:MAG: hypothetical protein IAG13_33170 [Deltaproteobacteria bacterium]|nr:hypothetical protein [Nannocystaceae bacterium]